MITLGGLLFNKTPDVQKRQLRKENPFLSEPHERVDEHSTAWEYLEVSWEHERNIIGQESVAAENRVHRNAPSGFYGLGSWGQSKIGHKLGS